MNIQKFKEAENLLSEMDIIQREIELLKRAKGYCGQYDRYIILASKHINMVEDSISFLAFPEIEEAIDKAIERMKIKQDIVERKFKEL